MDSFSPCQFSHVHRRMTRNDISDQGAAQRVLSQAPESKRTWLEQRPQLPCELAFAAIGFLNTSVFTYKKLMLRGIRLRASLDYHRWMTKHRWVNKLLTWSGSKSIVHDLRLVLAATQGLENWLRKVALHAHDSRWWTYVTANFVHLDASHISNNLGLLAACAEVTSQLPNMTPWHILLVTIGSSVSGSCAMKYWWFQNNVPAGTILQPRAFGASAIVSGFICLTAVAAPMEYMSVSIGLFELRTRYYFFAAMTILMDVLGSFGLLGSKNQKPSELRIGHAAHLGGAIFGVAYYYLVLRTRGSPQPEATSNTAHASPTTVLTASPHYGVPNTNLAWSDQREEVDAEDSQCNFEYIGNDSRDELLDEQAVEQAD